MNGITTKIVITVINQVIIKVNVLISEHALDVGKIMTLKTVLPKFLNAQTV